MPYICYCKDHRGSLELGREQTPARLDYIETILDRRQNLVVTDQKTRKH